MSGELLTKAKTAIPESWKLLGQLCHRTQQKKRGKCLKMVFGQKRINMPMKWGFFFSETDGPSGLKSVAGEGDILPEK